METYTLVTLVALFLGVMGVIAMMEHRRRTDLTRFEQLNQTLSACLGSLQSIHSSNEAQMTQVVAALSQLHTAIQADTGASSEATQSLSSNVVRALDQAAAKFSGVSQANTGELVGRIKELVERLEWFAKQLTSATQTGSKELQAEAQRTTKAIESLKASLEESVKF